MRRWQRGRAAAAAGLLASLLVLGAAGCGGDDDGGTAPRPDDGGLQQQGTTYWWNDQVFYEVFVRSFQDSDGDGRGDLPGLIDRLDYLNDGNPATTTDLGVTALWLMPVTASPSYHGYDTTDYRNVEPDYGSNADFQALMAAARARGMRVIIDFVLNHCSNQHPWFQAAAANDPARRNWFLWSATNPGWTQPWGGGPVWHAGGGAYYYGVFWSGMPDLNYTNPLVEDEMLATAGWWLDAMGADGFRLDAVKYVVEEGALLQDTASNFAFWGRFRARLDADAPDAFTVGEAWDDRREVVRRYQQAGLHTCFEFRLAGQTIAAVNAGNTAALAVEVAAAAEAYPFQQYATFLANHDMNRVYNQLGRDPGRNAVAASLLLSLPGVPFLYYGEEVGMEGTKPDEDIRRPMQWTPGPGAGFTTGTPWHDLNANYAQWNVATLAEDPGSLWHRYRQAVQARAASSALRRGTYAPLAASNASLVAFLRRYEGEAVAAVHNLRSGTAGGWSLSAFATQLPAGRYLASDLVTGQELAPLTVGANGSIAGWAPVGYLTGYASLLVRLVPEPVPAGAGRPRG